MQATFNSVGDVKKQKTIFLGHFYVIIKHFRFSTLFRWEERHNRHEDDNQHLSRDFNINS